MNKIFNIFALSVLLFSVSSCYDFIKVEGGTVGDDETYIFTADKYSLESDGKDMITFTLIDRDTDLDLTEAALSKVYFKNLTTGESLPRGTRTFSSITDGSYEFEASFGSAVCGQKVTIISQNRSRYEKYHKNVAVIKITSESCSACPDWGVRYSKISDYHKEHAILMECHGNFQRQDKYSLQLNGKDLALVLGGKFWSSLTWPSSIYDMRSGLISGGTSDIERNIEEQLWNNTATCGMKISTSLSSGELKIDVTLCSEKDGNYDIAYAVLLDNEYYPDAAFAPQDNTFSEILYACSENISGYQKSSAFEAVAGKEVKKSFTLSNAAFDAKKKNLRVVALAMRVGEDGKSLIDNSVECPVGASVDYSYN